MASKKNTVFGFPIWVVVLAVVVGAFALQAPSEKIQATIVETGAAGETLFYSDLGSLSTTPSGTVGCRSSGGANVQTSKTVIRSDGKPISGFEIEPKAEASICGGYLPLLTADVICNKAGAISSLGTFRSGQKSQKLDIDCDFLTINFNLKVADFVSSSVTTITKGSATITLIPKTASSSLVGTQSLLTKQTINCPSTASYCKYKTSGYCGSVKVGTIGKISTDNCLRDFNGVLSSQWFDSPDNYICEGIIPAGTSTIECTKFASQCVPTVISGYSLLCSQQSPKVTITAYTEATPTPVTCTSDTCYTRTRNEATNTCTETFVGQCNPNDIVSCTTPDGYVGKKSCSAACSFSLCSKIGVCIPNSQEACGDCGTRMCGSTGQWGACQEVQNACGTGFRCVLR